MNKIELFIKVFESELIPINSDIEITNNEALHESRHSFIIKHWQNFEFLILGYEKRKLIEALDSYEFYLTILSFFEKYGKTYRKTELLDGKYSETISISFYNWKSNKIEVLTVSDNCFANQHSYMHFNLLGTLKKMIFNLIEQIFELKLTAAEIKLFSYRFLELQKEDGSKTTFEEN